jgi:hypothetical protein
MLDEQFFLIGREIAEELLGELQKPRPVANTEYQRAMLYFLTKAYKAFQAVEVLAKEGFVEDAMTLARSIYEMRLQSHFLGNDPDVRSALFFDHVILSSFGTLQVMKRLPPNRTSELDKSEDDLRAGANAMNRAALLTDPIRAERAISKKWWSGSIKSLLQNLDHELEQKDSSFVRKQVFEREYDVIYSMLSDYAHSGVRPLHKYLVEESYRPSKGLPNFKLVAWSVFDWLSQIVGFTGRAFSLDFDDTVAKAQKKVLSVLRPTKQNDL